MSKIAIFYVCITSNSSRPRQYWAQSAGAIEYNDCISAERKAPTPQAFGILLLTI